MDLPPQRVGAAAHNEDNVNKEPQWAQGSLFDILIKHLFECFPFLRPRTSTNPVQHLHLLIQIRKIQQNLEHAEDEAAAAQIMAHERIKQLKANSAQKAQRHRMDGDLKDDKIWTLKNEIQELRRANTALQTELEKIPKPGNPTPWRPEKLGAGIERDFRHLNRMIAAWVLY